MEKDIHTMEPHRREAVHCMLESIREGCNRSKALVAVWQGYPLAPKVVPEERVERRCSVYVCVANLRRCTCEPYNLKI
jgi:hypothetical protein